MYESPADDGDTGYATIQEPAYENAGVAKLQDEEPETVVKESAVYEKLHTN